VPDDASQTGEKYHPDRANDLHTLFGVIRLRRHYYYDLQSQTGRFPLDQALGLVQSFSPAPFRLCPRAAAKEGYESASEDLLAQAGVIMEGRQIQRLVNRVAPAVAAQLEAGAPAGADPIPILCAEVDGTGVPMGADELAGRPGKQEDGSAKTRELKLGAISPRPRLTRRAWRCATINQRPMWAASKRHRTLASGSGPTPGGAGWAGRRKWFSSATARRGFGNWSAETSPGPS